MGSRGDRGEPRHSGRGDLRLVWILMPNLASRKETLIRVLPKTLTNFSRHKSRGVGVSSLKEDLF